MSSTRPKDTIRLNREELNQLLDAAFLETKEQELTITSDRSFTIQTHFRVVENEQKFFALLPVAKDSEDKGNLPQLPYVGDVIAEMEKKAEQDPSLKNATLLIPMQQCRGFAKITTVINAAKREHIVLVEVNLPKRSIQVHDSQSKLRYKFYPDKLRDIAEAMKFTYKPDQDYHAYDTQSDEVLCGYYVHRYVKACVEGKDCKEVKLKLGSAAAEFSTKEMYLESNGVLSDEKKYSAAKFGKDK